MADRTFFLFTLHARAVTSVESDRALPISSKGGHRKLRRALHCAVSDPDTIEPSIRGRDKGKPVERRGRKATGLPHACTTACHAG